VDLAAAICLNLSLFSFCCRYSASSIIANSKSELLRCIPISFKWSVKKSKVILSELKKPWKEASRVKQFAILNSRHKTTRAVVSLLGLTLNLQEKNRNISVFSLNNFGIPRH
jgi:hypothetical protein